MNEVCVYERSSIGKSMCCFIYIVIIIIKSVSDQCTC